MIKTYFRTAVRSLKKDPVFSAINIFGLALGLAVSLLITLFVRDELHYDKYNDKADRIFRIVSDIHINGNGINSVNTTSAMGPALVKDEPRIEAAVRIRRIQGGVLVRKGTETWTETAAVLADPSLFDVFTLPMVAGNPHTALATPNSLVISAGLAKKYFNSTEALGQTIRIDNDTANYTITGVIKDMPAQSHFHFHLIKSLAGKKFDNSQAWINLYSSTYVLTRPGVNTATVDHMLAAAVTKYLDPQVREQLHNTAADMEKKGNYFRYYAMPLTQIHLHSHLIAEFEPNGNISFVYTFIVLAVFILLVACINFTNLSTARSARRSREVGVRKVLGGSRWSLITQFMSEAMFVSLIAVLMAIAIALILLPYFNQLSGKSFSIRHLLNRYTLPFLIISSLATGLLAGSYPAFFLSAFQPIQVLQDRLGFKKSRLRSSLIVFQFTIAMILVVGTLVIYDQLHFIQNRQLGYDRQQVLIIRQTKYLGDHANTFRQQVAAMPGVVSSTMTSYLPNIPQTGTRGFFKDAGARANESFLMGDWRIDADYIPTLKMEMVMGRNFSPALATDSSGVLINETAAHLLGYTDPVGKFIYTGPDPVTPFRILGVVKDFNAQSLHSRIEPIVFTLSDETEKKALAVRIDTKDIPGLLARIKRSYTALSQDAAQPFVYSFLDDEFNSLYIADQRTGSLFIVFTVLSLLIACLGLLGLVTYAAEQRAKEVGIRRVLGAGIRHIVILFASDFISLLLLAMLIAFPLAWWGMHQWLVDFAYRVPVKGWVFATAAACVAGIALFTIGLQAVRAASVNPIERLRSE